MGSMGSMYNLTEEQLVVRLAELRRQAAILLSMNKSAQESGKNPCGCFGDKVGFC